MNEERFEHGLVIGKFLPPHAGHHHLIDTALDRCDRVSLLLCAREDDPISGDLRQRWLEEVHPGAEVIYVHDTLDADDTLAWAANTLQILGGPPDAVFTSEDYGDPYAAAMGCRHVLVDRERLTHPISGTIVRGAPLAMFEHLERPVRGYFAVRVIVLGAESTGTTTLANDLGLHYSAPVVAEYGRLYSLSKEGEWRTDEFEWIASRQAAIEDSVARVSHGLVIGDTDAFTTSVWHWRYMGFRSPDVEAIHASRPATLTLLTGDEIPFVQDGTRDGEHIRHAMHQEFERRLGEVGRPYHLLRGSREERLRQAIALVDAELLARGARLPLTPFEF